MHLKAVCAAVAVCFLGWGNTAVAQSQFAIVFDYHFPPEPLNKIVRDALDLPYGRAVLARFAEAVTKTADPACLRSRKLDSPMLINRGRALFQKYGTAMFGNLAGMVDPRAYASALRAAGEPDAAATLDRLTMNVDVNRLMELVQPARLAHVDNFIAENFDRSNLLTRREFPPISPFAAGNEALAAQDPTDDALKAGIQYIKSHDSPDLRRFVALSALSQRAIGASSDPDKARASGPGEWFRGIDKDLAGLCVKPSRK